MLGRVARQSSIQAEASQYRIVPLTTAEILQVVDGIHPGGAEPAWLEPNFAPLFPHGAQIGDGPARTALALGIVKQAGCATWQSASG